ncbi:MAG: hypothetical protein VXZ81_07075 [Pseudomonadota bacterium]|nr:hypothetical protein [Pseudomonadota bacterium]
MTEIPDEEKASLPIGMAALFGILIGICSHEFLLRYFPSYLWFSWVAIFPGLYLLRIWSKGKLKSMGVIESDDMTISRKLMGKVSYSESFNISCKLLFSVCFLIITVGGNLLAVKLSPESASIIHLFDLIEKLTI